MYTQTILFYFFALMLLFAAFKVITSRNTVHAALYLVLAFFQASALWLMLRAEFLAITLMVVYVGAVMVLFLFVVMMLNMQGSQTAKMLWRHMPIALFLGLLVAVQMMAVLFLGYGGITDAPSIEALATQANVSPDQYSNTKELGKVLYSQYLYPLQAGAVVLLVAIIAAIALTLRERKDTRSTSASQQVRVKAKDRMVVVNVLPAPVPASLPVSEADPLLQADAASAIAQEEKK